MTSPSPYPASTDVAYRGYTDTGFTGRIAVRRDSLSEIRPADEIVYPPDGSEAYISYRIVGNTDTGATIYLAGFTTASERDTYWDEHITDWLT